MFSFEVGTPIAAICGGPNNGKIVHLADERDDIDIEDMNPEVISDVLGEMLYTEQKRCTRAIRPLERARLANALVHGHAPADENLQALYKRAVEALKEKAQNKEITLQCGEMFILPSELTERVFIAGKSGSGKSCIAAKYMNEFRRLHPDRTIFLISRHDDDPAYKPIPHTQIPLSAFENLEKGAPPPIELEELANSLVVFDDCDNLQDKKVSEACKKLCDSIITNGRKFGIYSLWLNHLLLDYKNTRTLLMEANKVIFFLSGDNRLSAEYLKRYMGFSAKTIKRILELKSRWVCLSTTMPNYVIHEHGAFLI